MGWLAERFPKKYVMLLIYLLIACAIPLLFIAPFKGGMYVFAVIFGIDLGGDYMIIPLMTAEILGVRILAPLMSFLLAADSGAEAVSRQIVARLHHGRVTYSS